MKNKKQPDKKEKSIADLLHEIRTGILDPGILSKEQRQLCVEALHFESVSPSGIAQFLKVTDRTVRRDMEDIRMRNALTPDPDLARQIIGEYTLFARVHRGNLMKLARSAGASVSEKAQAEYYAYMVGADMIAKLQSLGYLPKSADALVVMQKREEREYDEKLATLCTELDDMGQLSSNPEMTQKLIEIKKTITKEIENAPNEQ